MTAWNDTFGSSLQWASAAFLNMFVDAVNERIAALGDAASTQLSHVAVGDNVQSAGGIIHQLQSWVTSAGNYGRFADQSIALTSPPTTAAGCAYTGSGFSTATGLTWNGAAILARRKCPREIGSTAATADLQGNAAAPGQIAWLGALSDPYICVSSGSWQRAPTGSVVDVLDSHAGTLSGGPIGFGDYIGSHLFSELRDALNAMTSIPWAQATDATREKTVTPNAGSYYPPFNTKAASGSGSSSIDWATAKSALSLGWPGATNTTGHTTPNVTYEGSETNSFPSTMNFHADAVNVKWSIGGTRAYFDIPLTFTPMVYYIATIDKGSNVSFDANGVAGSGGPIAVGGNLMDSTVVDQASVPTFGTGGLNLAYPLVGDYGSIVSPPNPCSAPPTNGNNSSGYRVAHTYMVEDYAVSGGFAYTIHT